jgi:hypothetical protein
MSVRLCQLKEQTSKAGRKYLSGLLDDIEGSRVPVPG